MPSFSGVWEWGIGRWCSYILPCSPLNLQSLTGIGAGPDYPWKTADGEPSSRRWGLARCGSGGGRGSESGAQKAPPRRGEGRAPWLPDCLVTAGLSLPPHYHRQGYCCDYCYYGDDDGYDGQTAAGGCACGSGRTSGTGRAGSPVIARSARSAIRTGGTGFTLGADGTARPSGPRLRLRRWLRQARRPWEPRAPEARQARQARQRRGEPTARWRSG